MNRWIMRIALVAVLACVTAMVYAQGRRPGGPIGRPFFESRERPEAAEPRRAMEPPRAPAPPRVVVREDDDDDEDEAASESRRGEREERSDESSHHARRKALLAALIVLLVLLVTVPVLVTVLWVLPISLGVWIARRRKLSPLWMLFGICPLGGWIACLVLALSRGKAECATCGGYVKRNYRQCPCCHGALPGASGASPA